MKTQVEVEAILLSKDTTKMPQVKTEDVDLENLEGVYMVIGRNLVTAEALKSTCSVLIETGFILSRESLLTTMDSPDLPSMLLQLNDWFWFWYRTLDIIYNLKWLKPRQDLLKSDDEVVLYSFNDDTGVLGLCNTLRREGKKVRSLLVCNQQASNDFHHEQLKKGFATNLFKDGKWGTYRNFPAKAPTKVKSEHCFIRANMERSD